MSNWTKGSKVEKLRREHLEKEGWMVRQFPKSRFGKQDLFGFDLIAIKDGIMRFEQVKSLARAMPSMRKQTLTDMIPLYKQMCSHIQMYYIRYNVAKKEWKIARIKDPYEHL